jgi:hypothetical protein
MPITTEGRSFGLAQSDSVRNERSMHNLSCRDYALKIRRNAGLTPPRKENATATQVTVAFLFACIKARS